VVWERKTGCQPKIVKNTNTTKHPVSDRYLIRYISSSFRRYCNMPSIPIYIEPWGCRLHHNDKYTSGLKLTKQYFSARETIGDNAALIEWHESFVQALCQKAYWVSLPSFSVLF